MNYRPWGSPPRVLSLTGNHAWHYLGVLGTEQRSITSFQYFRTIAALTSVTLIEIQDEFSTLHSAVSSALLLDRRKQFCEFGGTNSDILTMPLLSNLVDITRVAKAAASIRENVVLDISSFPKRFFFPVLRYLLTSSKVRNLLLTYTAPASYAPEGEPLHEDTDNTTSNLPGFGNSEPIQDWIVSVGFLVESLREHFRENSTNTIQLLVPFPAPLAAIRRTWKSVEILQQSQSPDRIQLHRVDTLDLSAAFDRIVSLSSHKTVAFAPFGPKPISAAMCLYSSQTEALVHYPQPKVYHPRYSEGIKDNDPATAVTAYWVKHDGENLYRVPESLPIRPPHL